MFHARNRSEIVLRFQVPAASRAAVRAAVEATADAERQRLVTLALDTPEQHLARAGLRWQLRREGRHWIQSLQAAARAAEESLPHEVIVAHAGFDPRAHEGSPLGGKLQEVLSECEREGSEVAVCFQCEVRRDARRVRTRGAVVDLAFDDGKLVSDAASVPLRTLEFRLVSGSASAMAALAERWRHRHALLLDPVDLAERGLLLAAGSGPALRKGRVPPYQRSSTVREAFAAVIDECLQHVTFSATGVVEAAESERAEQVHQARVGIRRLRSALRAFEDWVEMPPQPLVDALRRIFDELGRTRDSDVLGSGVMAALRKAGAPELQAADATAVPDARASIACDAAQHTLLAWLAWRLAFDVSEPADEPAASDPPRRMAARRLRQWHKRVAADADRFEALGEAELHRLRRRIKRLRYAAEFFQPWLGRRRTADYLRPLAAVQELMGELNDLFVARALYQDKAQGDPGAWFALGWIAARIEAVRAQAAPAARLLGQAKPPG